MKDQIAILIADALKDLVHPDVVVDVQTSEDASHGDYTTNVAMKVATSQRSPARNATQSVAGGKVKSSREAGSRSAGQKSPMDLALSVKEAISYQLSAISQKKGDQNIVKRGQKMSDKLASLDILSVIDRIEVAPPGFINVFLSEASLITSLTRLLKLGESVGKGQASSVKPQASSKAKDVTHDTLTHDTRAKRIMVEFAHPNTHKAFHIGHLRNITTGESIIRLLESQGHDVIRVNYQGDVGMHIAKCMFALLKLSPYKEEVRLLSSPRTRGSSGESNSDFIKARVEFLGKAYAAGSKAFEEDAAAKEEIGYYNALIYAAAQRLAREKGIDPGTTDYLALVPRFPESGGSDSGNLHDPATVYELWKETRQWSLDYFETIYKRVGTRYDRYYFESECLAGVDLARDAVLKGVLKEDAGAVIFDGKPYGIDTRVFINSKGLPTYEGKELKLATMESTEHGKLDRMIHVVGPEQASFFQVTFKAEERLGIVKPGIQHHLIYGWVKLKQGKMSSRSGNVVLGEWLLDEAKKSIYTILDTSDEKDNTSESSPRTRGSSVQKMEDRYSPSQKAEIAEKAAVAAVKYAFLRVGTLSEIAFDLETSVSFDGDSGPYLQYTYARCRSVLRKAEKLSAISYQLSASQNGKNINPLPGCQLSAVSCQLNSEERAVARLLTFFPDVVADAAEHLSPSTLCTFLFKLAATFNAFYAKHSILGSSDSGERSDQASFRLSLTAATAQVLSRGLYLLGIETLEQM
ncbi:MAG: arginine--tRNA ligase [Patescibacteria group bacterium]